MYNFFKIRFLLNFLINKKKILLNRPILQQLAVELSKHLGNTSQLLSAAVAQLGQILSSKMINF
jgi:hypothetical protein